MSKSTPEIAQLESYADLCWAEASDEYRQMPSEDRVRLLTALETTQINVVLELPAGLLDTLCGFALAAIVEARLRVERLDYEGNEYDDHFGKFEPD